MTKSNLYFNPKINCVGLTLEKHFDDWDDPDDSLVEIDPKQSTIAIAGHLEAVIRNDCKYRLGIQACQPCVDLKRGMDDSLEAITLECPVGSCPYSIQPT